MMEQFSVYKNQGRNGQNYPYFITVQSGLLSHLSTRLVMPLARKSETNSQVKSLTPQIKIGEYDFVVLTSMLTTTEVKNLSDRNFVRHAAELRDEIVSAIDLLLPGI